MPTPSSDDFKERFSLLEIPTSAQYRANLRLFLITDDYYDDAYWRIMIFDSATDELIVDENLDWDALPALVARVRSFWFAGKEMKHLLIPDMLTRFPTTATTERLRVEVMRAGAEESAIAWGFITVTDNVSQQVTVIAP